VTRYLTYPVLLRIARRACGSDVVIRDAGLLESALARPRAAMYGQDAYPTVFGKAGALLHSLVSNHGLVDGNKRLGWQAAVVFLWINGHDVDAPENDAFDLVMAVADASVDDVETIAEALRTWSSPRPPDPPERTPTP
jgi:death-on-curing protein